MHYLFQLIFKHNNTTLLHLDAASVTNLRFIHLQIAMKYYQSYMLTLETIVSVYSNVLLFENDTVQKNFAFYVIFEESLVICMNNPVSAKFSLMRHRL